MLCSVCAFVEDDKNKTDFVGAKISDAVVVLSKADYDVWKAAVKHKERLKQIYNFPCFDLEKPRFDVECKTVLAVGRLEEQKGFDYLLDIWKFIENTR